MGRRGQLLAIIATVGLLTAPVAGAIVWPIVWVTPLPEETIPTAQPTPAEFQVFDDAVIDYMRDRGIMAVSLAVAVDGEEIYQQGYGWMRPSQAHASPVVQPDALFRIASITKPHTEVVVRHLAEQGELSTSDHAFCLPGSPSDCHLDIEPYNGVVGDDRLKDITLEHLLDHEGGWDRYASGHVMFENGKVADALGVPSPPTTAQIVAYQMAQALDFAPGTDRAYSNFGYAVLGLIIEKITGHTWAEQIKHVAYGVPLDKVGTATEDGVDVEQGYALTPDRNDREPTYHCPGMTRHAFDPFRQAYARTCWPDGGWALKPIGAAGSLIASAPAILDFSTRYWLWGESRAENPCDGCWSYFYGSLDGTLTLSKQRTDDMDYAILLTKRWDSYHGLHYDIMDAVDAAADVYMAAHGSTSEESSPLPMTGRLGTGPSASPPTGHMETQAAWGMAPAG